MHTGESHILCPLPYPARCQRHLPVWPLTTTERGAQSRLPPSQLCQGNRYTTTLHTINSAVVKLGKLQPAMKVYRGVTGGMLPEIFWHANQHNVRGGCEYGFLSTTTDRHVATDYAASGGKAGIVFEIQMGMVDRGASLSWLSQVRGLP